MQIKNDYNSIDLFNKHYVLVSAELSHLTKIENAARSRAFLDAVESFKPIECLGRYRGVDELSYLIEVTNASSYSHSYLSNLIKGLDQECHLLIHGNLANAVGYSRNDGKNIGTLELIESLRLDKDYIGVNRPESDHTAIKIAPGWYRIITFTKVD